MFTDIVDSTKLVEALGEDKWRKLLDWHDRRLRELIEEAGGDVIKQTGDGFFAAFRSSGAALEAAVAIQRALDENEPSRPTSASASTPAGRFTRMTTTTPARASTWRRGSARSPEPGEILVSVESLDGGSAVPPGGPRSELLKGFEQPVELAAVAWR